MDHVAIMRKSWKLIPKILEGRKKIESRWSVNKVLPWGKIKKGDTVYFKNAGEPVTVKAEVFKVTPFGDLTQAKVRRIIRDYGGEGKVCLSNLEDSYEWARNKRYCTLIYLNKVSKIEQFEINKNGFGIGAAWLTIENINSIKA